MLTVSAWYGPGASFGWSAYHHMQPRLQHRQIGVITRWTPVKNLTFSADLTYTHLDQKYAGTVRPSATRRWQAGCPLRRSRTRTRLLLLLRAQRNW